MVWKYIYKSISWWKFMIERRKRRENFIKFIVYVNYKVFDTWLLFEHKIVQW